MYRFDIEGVTVTDTRVSLHGCWDLGVTKRFQIVHVPVDLFITDSVLEALNQIHSDRKTPPPPDEWEQFLLFG